MFFLQKSNSNSTLQIDGNQKTKPSKLNDANVHQHRFKPKKRRPAPPPPPPVLPEAPSHSRQSSSDSSGYHEATSSFLHEEHSGEEKASSDSSGVSSLDAKGSPTQPSPPPIPNSKKKKAPAPPPPAVIKEKHVKKDPAPIISNLSRNKPKLSADPKKLATENSVPPKESVDLKIVRTDSVLLKDTEVHQKEAVKADHDQKEDTLVQKHCVGQEESKTAGISVILHQSDITAEPGLKVPQLSSVSVVPKCLDSSKDSIPRENAAKLDEVIAEKDHIAQEAHSIVRDPILPKKDRVILPDHVIPKDQVPKRDAEKKLDLPHLQESEGQQLRPQMTVAAKALPASSASTGELHFVVFIYIYIF